MCVHLYFDRAEVHWLLNYLVIVGDAIFLHVYLGMEDVTAFDLPHVCHDLLAGLCPLLDFVEELSFL